MVSSYGRHLSARLRSNVVCYDYTGYGLSTGRASEASCDADLRTVFSHLVLERGIAAQRVILLGRSLGAGPSIRLASTLGRGLGGMILVAAPASVLRVALWTKRTLPGDLFSNVDYIEEVDVPVLVVHGTRDRIVGPRHGVELVGRAQWPARPLWVQGGGHNDLEMRFGVVLHARYSMMLREIREWREERMASERTQNKDGRRKKVCGMERRNSPEGGVRIFRWDSRNGTREDERKDVRDASVAIGMDTLRRMNEMDRKKEESDANETRRWGRRWNAAMRKTAERCCRVLCRVLPW